MYKNKNLSTIKLDKIDKSLLYELDVDSRQSNIQIGKKLRISKDVVKYRIERMMKNGIITSFYTEMDAYKLGYFAFRMFLRFHNITVKKEKEIVEYFTKNPHVAWVHASEGNWDLLIGIWVKNIFEFYNYQEKFFDKYGNYIENKLISIYHRMYQFKKDYLLEKSRTIEDLNYMGSDKKVKLDEVDMKILKILVNNARMPLYELANRLKTSPKIISYRMKKLRKEKVILAFRPMINLGVLGYSWFKVHLHLKNINEIKRKNLFSYITSLPNTVYIDEMIGGYDFEIDLDLRNHIELRNYVEDIRNKFSEIVRDFETLDLYKVHKTLAWFPM